jgi:tRNA U34 5-methylaminomethyl-2-thiouridine-forming methyltransferase MnmC
MQRLLKITADGSHTVTIPKLDTNYHSHHGAIQESEHVFIQAGLMMAFRSFPTGIINILEIGYGTGLNALLTLRVALQAERQIHYTAIEKYPLTDEEFASLNHGGLLAMQAEANAMHAAPWDKEIAISQLFSLKKIHSSLPSAIAAKNIHCIYHDAFAPEQSPALWDETFFAELYNTLLPGGILVTYCSKTIIRKAMAAAGFTVTKIPGPWGKREMVRAFK